jgi:hypothetical protein
MPIPQLNGTAASTTTAQNPEPIGSAGLFFY